VAWLLSGGVWSDSGEWDDASFWEDGSPTPTPGDLTLSLIKQYLRVRHNDQDDLITDMIGRAQGWVSRYVGEEPDPRPTEMDTAAILLVQFYFYPDDKYDLDEWTDVPRAVVAQLRAYRTPTLQ
jgi:uncharacterized phage protein (predicted DNA packaging)